VGATTTAQLVWILAPRLPDPEGRVLRDDWLMLGNLTPLGGRRE
jgi:hypothetical protein